MFIFCLYVGQPLYDVQLTVVKNWEKSKEMGLLNSCNTFVYNILALKSTFCSLIINNVVWDFTMQSGKHKHFLGQDFFYHLYATDSHIWSSSCMRFQSQNIKGRYLVILFLFFIIIIFSLYALIDSYYKWA